MHFLPEIVTPGTELGTIRSSLAQRMGFAGAKVVAPPSHDTASAVAAVPTTSTGKVNWAYLSSGTWSLMGVEVREPALTPRTMGLNFSNEGGLDGTYRLLQNLLGLWVVQQCKRSFDVRGRKYDYSQLSQLAAKARPWRSLIDLNDPRFLNPADMPSAIQSYCRETAQPVPKSEGDLIRCAVESLALKYRQALGSLEELTGHPVEVIHIVGGGSQNRILNQLTADACERPVIAGPVEATAIGNLLTQVRASGELDSLAEMREVVRKSSDLQHYDPKPTAVWAEARGRLAELRLKNGRT